MVAASGYRGNVRTISLILSFAIVLINVPAIAGVFLFAEGNDVDMIVHPAGYTGSGGTVTVDVCIDPDSPNAADMVEPIRNLVDTYTRLVSKTDNVVIPSDELAFDEIDFESVAIHEVGHCLGLAHPNLAIESGVPSADRDYTKARVGTNNSYDLNAGSDGVKGSGDDIRGDDVNLHWFRKSNNNPFTIAETVDSTTYSRQLADLPTGHSYAASGGRDVANLLGAGSSEAVMHQLTYGGEEQRSLSHDDVATLRYARSGLDSVAGTGDDYTVGLEYVGFSDACDIVVAFDNNNTGFASCQVSGTFLSSNHIAITSANVYFNTGINWYFSERDTDGDGVPDSEDPDADGDGMPNVWENEHGLDPLDPSDADEDLDGDGLSNLEEFNAGTDPNNPDTDFDGIGDAFDNEPNISSNLCSGDHAILASQDVLDGQTLQCAAKNSIVVEDTVQIWGGGRLELISPVVSLDNGFFVPVSAEVSVRSADPTPP